LARKPGGENLRELAKEFLATATDAGDVLRARATLLPLEGLSLERTAEILGVSKWRVCRLRTQFIRLGGKPGRKTGRGGRRRENLNRGDEAEFLAPFIATASGGGEISVSTVRYALEVRLGRPVALASVYNLLNRHNWRRDLTSVNGATGPLQEEQRRTATVRGRLARHVNIINVDSRLPNLALEKVRHYYQTRGYQVITRPDMAGKVPTFVSVLFEKNRMQVHRYEDLPDTLVGGSGYDAKIKLPAEIEAVRPKINFGFTSRGCSRSCPFCIVPVSEGEVRVEGDLYDVWDGRSRRVTLLDNNILQLPSHFALVSSQVQKELLTVDWNQGLDFRLVSDEVAYILERTRMPDLRLALDSVHHIPLFREKLQLLRRYKVRRDPLVYLLVGFDSSWDEDMERIRFLTAEGCRPYVMRHPNVGKNSKYAVLQEWVNQFWPVKVMSYEKFERLRRERPDRKRRRLTGMNTFQEAET
jgi:hypothetical protein